MRYRFDQCEGIADGVVRRAMAFVGKASDTPDAFTHIVVHNPLPFVRAGLFEIPVAFRTDWPKRFIDGLCTAEVVNKFVLMNKDGARIPFQLSKIERNVEHKVLRENGRRGTPVVDVYHLAVELTLPSCGYAGFRVKPTDEGTRNFGTRMKGPLSASTGPITFWLNPGGVGCLMHQPSGAVYEDLFLYEDCGDSGDGWTRGPLINDIVYRSPGSRVATAIEEDGALRTVFRVEREFDLPRRMERKTYWRSEDRTPLRVTDWIYVEKGAPYLRVCTRVENTCMDHRFRVLFPTNIDAAGSFAETPFAIVERPIHAPDESARWQERVNPEKAFTTFFGVRTGSHGLAVLAPFGLHEYEVTRTPERSLALTLFRSTFKTAGMPAEPDGQLLGEMEFEYLLYPFGVEFDAVQVLRIIAERQAGVRVHYASELPDPHSFLELAKGTAVVTAVKPAADGQAGVIRLWNPAPAAVRDSIKLGIKVTSAALCNLNEEPRDLIPLNADGSIPVTIPARGLATVRFTWQ
jgi:hypothetical protein